MNRTCRKLEGQRTRSGFTLIESMITMILISMLASIFIPLTLIVARQQRQLIQRTVLQQSALNIVEEIHAHPAWTKTQLDQLLQRAPQNQYQMTYELVPDLDREVTRLDLIFISLPSTSSHRPLKLSIWIAIDEKPGDVE